MKPKSINQVKGENNTVKCNVQLHFADFNAPRVCHLVNISLQLHNRTNSMK